MKSEADSRFWAKRPGRDARSTWSGSWPAFTLTLHLAIALTACAPGTINNASAPTRALIATVPPDAVRETASPVAPATRTIIPDSGWVHLRPGLERRVLNHIGPDGNLVESLYILRIEPSLYRFDVAYRPGAPLSLEQWQQDTGALLVVNGGFYTEAFEATGLIVVDGEASGVSYTNFGGMLAITEEGPELRWLPHRPYDSSEPLLAGLQSFPMLIIPDGQPAILEDDGNPDRRTAIGLDSSGRVIFLVAAGGSFTLHQLSQYLLNSDLELVAALNLDGGTSTGLLLAEPSEGIAAYTFLPSVITVFPR